MPPQPCKWRGHALHICRGRREQAPASRSFSRSAPPRPWPGPRASTCRRWSPIRSRTISASPRTGFSAPIRRRWSSPPCLARASAARSIGSAAARCCRSPIWYSRRASCCSASRNRSRCSFWPGCCSASAWGYGLYDAAFGALGTHLWRGRARRDHRHHADCRLCLDDRLATDGAGPANHRLARHLLCLGGRAYRDRPAAQSVDAARRTSATTTAETHGQAAHPDRSHHGHCWRSPLPLPGSSPARWRRTSRASWKRPAPRRCRRWPPAR